MNIRKRYHYNTEVVSFSTGLAIEDNEQNNRTKQEFKDEVDINTLLRRFAITGQMPENVRAPTYGDFSEVTDFHSAMQAIAEANEAFERIPAEIRYERFGNDPEKFVAFCDNADNREEAEKLGLVFPRSTTTGSPGEPPAPPTPSTGGTEAPAAPAPQATP